MADMTMGQRIAEERKKMGISQEMLGEKMGVSRQAISKWESDGAVPEIDKLIVLSRLFSVSVGWLLGVEEAPMERSEDAFTETQLQTIEEIVKKYQPKPVKSKLQLVLMALISALGLVAITVMTLASMGIFDKPKANSEAIAALRYEINSQLVELDARISRQNATQPGLLADYDMEIAALTGSDGMIPAAQIRFTAMPNTWQEGNTGILSIRRDGMETILLECGWDGAFLTAETTLEVADGYDFSFVLRHADGTQEQQVVTDAQIQDLETTLCLGAGVTPGQWEYRDHILTLTNYETRVTMPMNGAFYGSLMWKQVDLVLTSGRGEELGRFNLLLAENVEDADLLKSHEIVSKHTQIRFLDLQLPRNEGVMLWIYAETDNGLSVMELANSWIVNDDGTLRDP